jgi:polar amino acid transport system permease protein
MAWSVTVVAAAEVTGPSPSVEGMPEEKVVPLRHPGRWVASVLIVVFAVQGVVVLVRNPRFEWEVVRHYAFSSDLLAGLKMTLFLTALAMGIGVALGILLAVMRVSRNPVVSWASRVYIWFFRGTPLLVQLIFWYNIAALFPTISVGLAGLSVGQIDANEVVTPFAAAMLGLGLNEGAYMSEIVRAGILSIGEGQVNAARALGMRPGQIMRTIVLPQAMRVIIPPTGNETIGMLKTTSLVSVISLSELLFSAEKIYSVNFETIPLLITVSLWYLLLTSILTVIQTRIEARFSKGVVTAVGRRRVSSANRLLRLGGR